MLTETTTPVTPSAAAIPTVVVLQCMDGCEFAVPYSQVKGQAAGIVALFAASKSKAPLVESTTPTSPLKLIKEDGETATMSVPHVSSFILSKVLAFLAAHQADTTVYNEQTFTVSQQDESLFSAMSNEDLLQFALAANILQIDSLLHTVGDIVGKRINASPADADAIAKMFDIDSLAVTDSTAATSKDDGEQEQEEEDGWEEIDEMGVSLSNASDEN